MTQPKLFAVLDDDTVDGSVIGWAEDAATAADVYNDYIQSVFTEPSNLTAADFRFRTEPVSYSPSLNTRSEAEAVERDGAWAPTRSHEG